MESAIQTCLATTPLSCRERSAGPLRRAFAVLAHMSLCAVLSSMLPACLIQDPPPYTEPQKTPPWLDLRLAVPLIDQVLVRNRGDLVPFTVPVRSEDAGDALLAYLLLNYMGEGSDLNSLDKTQVNPSTFDDLSRRVEFEWTITPTIPIGCQRLTMLVTHKSNVDVEGVPGLVVFDKSDLATAVWWVNVNTDAAASSMLQDCPPATERAN